MIHDVCTFETTPIHHMGTCFVTEDNHCAHAHASTSYNESVSGADGPQDLHRISSQDNDRTTPGSSGNEQSAYRDESIRSNNPPRENEGGTHHHRHHGKGWKLNPFKHRHHHQHHHTRQPRTDDQDSPRPSESGSAQYPRDSPPAYPADARQDTGRREGTSAADITSFPMFGSSPYGAQPGAYGGQPGVMGGAPPGQGPVIFLVPTRGVGTCSESGAPGMVRLPSMYSIDALALSFYVGMKRQWDIARLSGFF